MIVMLMTSLGKMSGFAREIALASKYGAGGTSDAFIIAYTMPTLLLMGIAGAIATTYIPVYIKLSVSSEAEAKKCLITCSPSL